MADTLAANKSLELFLRAGGYISLSGSGKAISTMLGRTGTSTLTSSTQLIGPYKFDAQIELVAAETEITYEVSTAFPSVIVVSADAPSNTDGRPNGTIYIQTA